MPAGECTRKPVEWMGKRYPSIQALATAIGVNPVTVAARLKRGITDERLKARRLNGRR